MNFPEKFGSRKIGFLPGVIILSLAFFGAILLIKNAPEIPDQTSHLKIPLVKGELKEKNIEEGEKEKEKEEPEFPYYYAPVPIDMDIVKSKGCVTDGILSGYGKDTDKSIEMINRSNCLYLHRALETWADTPDFEKASRIMERIEKPGIIYGMFIAEAIKTNADFLYENGERDFKFRKMCREGTKNVWGEHTCKPELESLEYRKYIKYITRKAMDLGIQSFLFGQIYYQDYEGPERERLKKVIEEMREYAEEKNMDIIIGAQTGAITDEEYLRMFDYIEGGVGIGEDGLIEDGPCWSYKESCWALLWHDRYAKRAENVLLHLDWSGLKFDDMSVFARMPKEKRTEILENLYNYFTPKDMGFLMPMMATLNKDNGGCRGPEKGFYSASNEYTCQDEDVINSILQDD